MRKVFESRGCVRRAEINPADHTLDRFVLCGEVEKEKGLTLGLIRLHGDAAVHPIRSKRSSKSSGK